MSANSRLLLKNTPEDVLAISFSDTLACQEIVNSLSLDSAVPAYTIWLTQIEQIHQFVRQIPNLAWELMDYATEPLSIVYTHTKPLFPNTANPDEVCVRLIFQDSLRKALLGKHAWLAVNADAVPFEFSSTNWIEKEIDMKRGAEQLKPVKVMRVSDNGEFSFLT